jgi:uncharacterized protein YajQ (UPF0234 family)
LLRSQRVAGASNAAGAVDAVSHNEQPSSFEVIMPSFDVVSELNMHEVANAIDQANREVTTRFDFKDSGARYEIKENTVTLQAQSEFQVKQMREILQLKMTKRGIDISCLEFNNPESAGKQCRQSITLKQGIDAALGRKITGLVKESKLKVQAAIQGDQIRITGKKRDDLQAAITLLRDAKLDIPLQYTNFRE